MNLAYNTSRLFQLTYQFPEQSSKSFHLFSQRVKSILVLLQSCRSSVNIYSVHAYMIKRGLDKDVFLTSKLLDVARNDAYYAVSIFNNAPDRNLFMFNSILRVYSTSNQAVRAFELFHHLRRVDIELDQFSFVLLAKICASETAIDTGRMLHGLVLRYGFLSHSFVKNGLLHLYSVCGEIADACKLFDEIPDWNDVVSYNTIVKAHAKASQPVCCIQLLQQMLKRGITVTSYTLVTLFSALCHLGNSFRGGECAHGFSIKIGLGCDPHVKVLTSIIKFYAHIGCIDICEKIFNSVSQKDTVMFNCMISVYSGMGMLEEAMVLLNQMKTEGVKIDSSTCVTLLSACAATALSGIGLEVFTLVKDAKLELDGALGTACVDMLLKCGNLEMAVDIFEKMRDRDVKCWTAMISGYGFHGEARNAVLLLERMVKEGVTPNEVTFCAALSACSHGGLLQEARECYKKMVYEYSLEPSSFANACIVDLLARKGLLEEAYAFAKRLRGSNDGVVWRALLSGCRLYGSVEMAKLARKELMEMKEEHPSDLLLLAGTSSTAGSLPGDVTWVEEPAKECTKGIDPQTKTHWFKKFLNRI